MRSLTNLSVEFKDINDYLDIFKECIGLRILNIHGEAEDKAVINYAMKLIERVKSNFTQRTSPITLIFSSKV